MKRLLETKFPGVVERVEGVLRFVGKHGAAPWMEAAFVEFTATLHHRLAGLGPVFVRDIGEIAELARRCRDFAGRFDEEQRQGPVADVVARHVHNSRCGPAAKSSFSGAAASIRGCGPARGSPWNPASFAAKRRRSAGAM